MELKKQYKEILHKRGLSLIEKEDLELHETVSGLNLEVSNLKRVIEQEREDKK